MSRRRSNALVPVLALVAVGGLVLASRAGTSAPSGVSGSTWKAYQDLYGMAAKLEAAGDVDGAAALRSQADGLLKNEGVFIEEDDGGWWEGVPDPGDLGDLYEDVTGKAGEVLDWGMDRGTEAMRAGIIIGPLIVGGLIAGTVLLWNSQTSRTALDKLSFSVG